jgi:hypothetical protein
VRGDSITIRCARVRSESAWFATAYDGETGELLWSADKALSLPHALEAVARKLAEIEADQPPPVPLKITVGDRTALVAKRDFPSFTDAQNEGRPAVPDSEGESLARPRRNWWESVSTPELADVEVPEFRWPDTDATPGDEPYAESPVPEVPED